MLVAKKKLPEPLRSKEPKPLKHTHAAYIGMDGLKLQHSKNRYNIRKRNT